MKKLAALLLAGAMALSLAGCAGGANSDKLVMVGVDSAGRGAAAQLFGELTAEKVAETSGGNIVLDYHPNGDLGDDATLLRQTSAGWLNLVVCQTAPVVSLIPEMAVFDLPMVFAKYDGDTIDQVLNSPDSEFFQQMSAAYEKAGFHLLGFLQNATYRLTTSNKAVNTLADFKGLIIRTMENSNHVKFWQAIDAQPSPLAWSETYFALQTGARDAEENAADTIVGANLQEVQKYLACTNHILYVNQMAVSKKTWDSMTPEQQEALNEAVAQALEELRPQLLQIDQENKDKLINDPNYPMTLVEYDNSFFDEVLADPEVVALYKDIDAQTNGLGTILQESLEAAAAG